MDMDGNGAGQVVAHALLRNEHQETLHLFLSKLKELNSATIQTKLFIVDKDFNEMAVLRELWPDAEVFLCLFHVLKSLKQRIAILAISQEKKEELKNLCQDLVDSRTEDSYDDAFAKLREKAAEECVKYFAENWTNCREMWVEFSRKKTQHMGNRTTNRVESFHG